MTCSAVSPQVSDNVLLLSAPRSAVQYLLIRGSLSTLVQPAERGLGRCSARRSCLMDLICRAMSYTPNRHYLTQGLYPHGQTGIPLVR